MMDRRRFIAAAGAATVTGLAGCSGNSEDGTEEGAEDGTPTGTPTEEPPEIEANDGPAEFAVYSASWVDGDDVTVDGDGQVELVIGNRGGEPGQFSGGLIAESLVSSQADLLTGDVSTIEEDIASGETVTVTSETVTPAYAGRYEATIGEAEGERLPVADDADVELLVAPHRGASDETLPLKNDLRMHVKNIQLEQGIHYDTQVSSMWGSKDRVALNSTLDDQTFVIAHAVVENAGNTAATVNADWFKLADETALSSMGNVRDLDTDALHDTNVNPGNQVTGWLLFRVNRDAVSDATLEAYRDTPTAAADTVWELDIGDVDFPTFELQSMDVPNEFDNDVENQPLNFTIKNTGDGVGTFRGELEWREEGESGWDELQPGNADLVARIPPGETATVSSETTYIGDTSFEFRFNPFGATFLVE